MKQAKEWTNSATNRINEAAERISESIQKKKRIWKVRNESNRWSENQLFHQKPRALMILR